MREVTPEAFLKLAGKCERAAIRGQGVPLLEEAQLGFEEAASRIRELESKNKVLLDALLVIKGAVVSTGLRT